MKLPKAAYDPWMAFDLDARSFVRSYGRSLARRENFRRRENFGGTEILEIGVAAIDFVQESSKWEPSS